MFAALRHRNFRLFYAGRFVSVMGFGMQMTARSWLVYRLTKSPFLLGVAGFAGQFPVFALGILGGAAADRYNKRKILFSAYCLTLIQAAALGFLTLNGVVQFWHVVCLALFVGVVYAFEAPTRQSFLLEVSSRKDLGNAIALHSSMITTSQMIAPTLAGILVVWKGEGVCFLANAASFITIMAALLFMRFEKPVTPAQVQPFTRHIGEGLSYLREARPLAVVLMLLFLVSLTGRPFVVLLPVFAGEIFQGGPKLFGYFMSAVGFGALTGTLLMAARKGTRNLGRIIGWSPFVLGLGVVGFAVSRWLFLSMVCLFVAGLGMMVTMVGANTLIQSLVKEGFRGRVMSFFSMCTFGSIPVGSLLCGGLAQYIGVRAAMILLGCALFCVGIWFLRRLPELRKDVSQLSEVGVLVSLEEPA